MAILKKTKHLLAALLCLCMVVAILPAGVPAAKAAATLSYDFMSPNVNDATLVNTLTLDKTDGTWAFYAENVKKHNFYKKAYQWGMNIGGLFRTDKYVAYTLKNVEKGFYTATVDHLISGSGVYAEFYLIPYEAGIDVLAKCTAETLIGGIKFQSDVEETVYGDVAGNINVAATGDYILVLRGTDVIYNDNTWYHAGAWMRGFNLVPIADGIYASLEADTVTEGESTTVAKIELAVGNAKIDASEYIVSVSVEDTTIASFSRGEINAIKPGSTNVIISITYGGNTYSATLPLTVKEIYRDRVISTEGLALTPQWVYLNTYTTPDMTNGDWVYHSSKTTYNGVDENWPLSNFNDTIDFRMTAEKADRYVAFKYINVLPGDYKVELVFPAYNGGGVMDFYLIPDCTTINLDTMCTIDTYLGRMNFYADHKLNGEADYKVLETEYLKDVTITEQGDYILVARGVTGRSIGGINFGAVTKEIRLDWQGAPSAAAPAGDDAFSSVYAYVRENVEKGNKSYAVTLVGGIDAADLADYNSVGFGIVSDHYINTLTDSAVFETLTLSDGGEIKAEDFGSDYIFVQSFVVDVHDIDDAYDFMTIKAVAEKADGSTINGDEYILQIGK